MEASAVLVVSFLFLGGLYYFYYLRRKNCPRPPPGPSMYESIVETFKRKDPPYRLFSNLAKKYGPIFRMKMGPLDMVVLSDAKILKQAFANPVFCGKSDNEAFSVMSGGKYGIITSDGETNLQQRRFTIRHLRDFGMGKNYMEELITEETTAFISRLKAEEGTPISLENKFSLAALNSLWFLMHGVRFAHDDARLLNLLKMHHEATTKTTQGGIAGLLILIPWLAKLFPKISGWQGVMAMVDSFHNVFRESIKEHQRTLDEDGTEPRDLVDAYLIEMKKEAKNPSSSFNEENGMKNLLAVITDLFQAGYETSSLTLSWAFLYLAMNLDVQKKLHTEIDTVVGHSRQPNLLDKPKMTWTAAIIEETLRISSIVPFGVFHSATMDTQFHGYHITKGTILTSNLYHIHNDPSVWGDDVDQFKPQRFIGQDGKLIKSENLLPFSTGKRACIGEGLARDVQFLFLTHIFQHFQVLVDPHSPPPSLEPQMGFMLAPQPFKVVVRERERVGGGDH